MYVRGRKVRRKAATKSHALLRLRELQAIHANGRLVTGRSPALGEYLRLWVSTRQLRPTTRTQYGYYIANYLDPDLARVRLCALDVEHVRAIMVAARGKVGPKTVNNLRAIIRAALNTALEEGKVTKNVAAFRSLALRVESFEGAVLDNVQARRFLEAVAGDPLASMYHLALFGPRKGELLGLRWGDVDLTARTVTINQQIQRIAGRLVAVAPKTGSSVRRFVLPRTITDSLDAHRRGQGEKNLDLIRPESLVFCTATGGPLDPRNVMQRSFYPLRRRLGLPTLRFHDLRASAVSILGAAGVPLEVVATIVGHTTTQTTARYYRRTLPQEMYDAADALDRALAEAR